MLEDDRPSVPPDSPERSPDGEAAEPRRETPRRRTRVLRIVRRGLLALVAIVAAVLVTVVTVDLGPALRARAEREGSRLINRPLHIGRLGIHLGTGRFVIEDLRIDGLRPGDAPFFTARELVVSLSWAPLLRGEVFIESILLTGWRMQVETFPDGRHSFIRLPTRRQPSGPRRFVTTVHQVYARDGQFTFLDHGAPWSTVARNLELSIVKGAEYRGRASFHGGTVRIQSYEPMWANMSCSFTLDGPRVQLHRIDLETDGAVSRVAGVVDMSRWPEQRYDVHSDITFRRMRELFFAKQGFTLAGKGTFDGTFHLYKGGRELKGRFASPDAGVNEWRFPNLRGAVLWVPDRLEVTDATSDFLGGRTAFSFSMKPLGRRDERATARLDAKYTDVDLARLSDFLELRGLRLAGRATGRTLLEYPVGRFTERRGDGELRVMPPAGTTLMTAAAADRFEDGEFTPETRLGYLPIGGSIAYRFGPEWIEIASGEVATPRTFVSFEGRTAYGSRSVIPFHVTSADWQESDLVLAGLLTTFGAPTRPIAVGGAGEFDGVMTGAFNRPRIEGRFSGRGFRAFDVVWGDGSGDVVIENAYATVSNTRIERGESRIGVDGRFSLGFPRRDGGEEVNARVVITRRPVVDLRHAFELDDYPIDGLLTGEFHVYGRYTRPLGFGKATLEGARAYGESFESGRTGLRFEGEGVRLDGIEIRKSLGTITGAAYLSWEGEYSFDVTGQRIPMESLETTAYPRAPLSGMLQFSASGSGTFDDPRYDVKGRVGDLFIADEGIGQVTGRISVRDRVLRIETLEIASPRLAASAAGRVNLTPDAEADLTVRFSDASIDPYVRAFQPGLSPFTTAVASGTIKVAGALRRMERLSGEAVVEELDLRLFDYRVRNDGPLRFGLNDQTISVDRLRLVGDGTQIEMFGEVRPAENRIDLRALGDASFSILQGFFRDIRSSGQAEVQAEITGQLNDPTIRGAALITDGRIRHFSLPHSVEALNGSVLLEPGEIRVQGLTGRLGGGDVRFAGRIGLDGFTPTTYNITASGQGMRIRYPEGFRSFIDAELVLRGSAAQPTLGGTVLVRSAVWGESLDEAAGTGILGLAAAGGATRAPTVEAGGTTFPLQFDIRIDAPSTLRIENRTIRLVSSADLQLRGTLARPLLFGRAEIDRGEVFFEGNRYLVTRGTIDFANPTRIEPFFDIEAETRARVPGEVYRVTFHVSGTPDRFVFDLSSDPPLATVEILSLLFGEVRDPQNADLRALRSPDQTEQELIAAQAARLLANPISSEVSRVIEQSLGVDTVQITPSLGDLFTQQSSSRLTPSARLTLGKRISNRLYLTFSRGLSTATRDQILLLEYTQSDRLSWVLSQNEDRTYALDVRVRHVF